MQNGSGVVLCHFYPLQNGSGVVLCHFYPLQNDSGVVLCHFYLLQNDSGVMVCHADWIRKEYLTRSWIYITLGLGIMIRQSVGG